MSLCFIEFIHVFLLRLFEEVTYNVLFSWCQTGQIQRRSRRRPGGTNPTTISTSPGTLLVPDGTYPTKNTTSPRRDKSHDDLHIARHSYCDTGKDFVLMFLCLTCSPCKYPLKEFHPHFVQGVHVFPNLLWFPCLPGIQMPPMSSWVWCVACQVCLL